MADAKKPKPLIICGPSGVGKGTVRQKLGSVFGEDKFKLNVSHTTRAPRPLTKDGKIVTDSHGAVQLEVDGEDYHFIDVPTFEKMMAEDKFVESTTFAAGKRYGTSKASLLDVRPDQICVLDIEMDGVEKIHAYAQAHADFDMPNVLYIKPTEATEPEAVEHELRERLEKRGSENAEQIEGRLQKAVPEINFINSQKVPGKVVLNLTDPDGGLDGPNLRRAMAEVERFVAEKYGGVLSADPDKSYLKSD